MRHARSFPPIEPAQARVLILGSLPGQASLAAQAYYAHPRNAFWPILCAVLERPAGLPYADRVQALRDAGIALWDVLAAAERPGSLDADIVTSSVRVNDIAGLLARHPTLGLVICNGGSAHTLFRRHVLNSLGARADTLSVLRLPSTSPAHAALPFAHKLTTWRDALQPWLDQTPAQSCQDHAKLGAES